MTRSSSSKALIVVATIVATVIGIGATVGAGGLAYALREFEKVEKFPIPELDPSVVPSGEPVPAGDCSDVCNYLVLGSDSRANLSGKEQKEFGSDGEIDGYRSDTMLLVSIDRETQHTTIVSFPRDLLVDVPGVPGLDGYGDKTLINAAFAAGATDGGRDGIIGGAELAAKTVQNLTGMKMDHLVVLDLEGFKAVVDAMGSVPYCTPHKLEDKPEAFPENRGTGNEGSGLYLDKGCHELDGDTALALVRARYVLTDGVKDCISDYARIRRQQTFMRALMNKLLSPETVTQIPDILGAVTESDGVVIDDELELFDLAELAQAMRGVASGNADFRVIPNELDRNFIHLEITNEGRTFLDKLRRGEPLGDLGTELQYQPPAPVEIAVRVYDDDSDGHAQNDVFNEQLRDAGFKLMAASAEPAGGFAGRGTVILYAPGAQEEGTILSGFVPGVKVQKAAEGELPEDTQVAVVVDESYEYQDPGDEKVAPVKEDCPFT